jgi:hypothetical protein
MLRTGLSGSSDLLAGDKFVDELAESTLKAVRNHKEMIIVPEVLPRILFAEPLFKLGFPDPACNLCQPIDGFLIVSLLEKRLTGLSARIKCNSYNKRSPG